jgi:TetR/AcrR family transcriptional regulator
LSPAVSKESTSRERILEEAAVEFAAGGFAGARIDRIARRTKLNVRMIYYHFGSKRGLYRAVLQSIYEQMSGVLEKLPRSAPNRTIEAFGLYFDLLTAEPRFADVLVRELLDGAKHLKALWKERPELFRQIHYHARALVDEGVAAGELRRELDPAMTVLSVTSIICFLTAARHSHALFLDERRSHPGAWKQHLQALLLDGLRAR